MKKYFLVLITFMSFASFAENIKKVPDVPEKPHIPTQLTKDGTFIQYKLFINGKEKNTTLSASECANWVKEAMESKYFFENIQEKNIVEVACVAIRSKSY